MLRLHSQGGDDDDDEENDEDNDDDVDDEGEEEDFNEKKTRPKSRTSPVVQSVHRGKRQVLNAGQEILLTVLWK